MLRHETEKSKNLPINLQKKLEEHCKSDVNILAKSALKFRDIFIAINLAFFINISIFKKFYSGNWRGPLPDKPDSCICLQLPVPPPVSTIADNWCRSTRRIQLLRKIVNNCNQMAQVGLWKQENPDSAQAQWWRSQCRSIQSRWHGWVNQNHLWILRVLLARLSDLHDKAVRQNFDKCSNCWASFPGNSRSAQILREQRVQCGEKMWVWAAKRASSNANLFHIRQ